MGLIGNYSISNKSCGRWLCGTSTSTANAGIIKSNWNSPNLMFSRAIAFSGESGADDLFTSLPGSYDLTNAIIPSVRKTKLEIKPSPSLDGTGAVVVNAFRSTLAASNNVAGVGGLTVAASQVIQVASSGLAGLGQLTVAVGIQQSLAATIAGVGGLTVSMQSLVPIASTIAGTGTISTADMRVKWAIACEILIGGTGILSPGNIEDLAAGVWDALAVDNNLSGSMGELVQRTEIKVDDATALIVTK